GFNSLRAQPGTFKPTAESQYKENLVIRRYSIDAMRVVFKKPSNYIEVKQYVAPFNCMSAIHKYNILGSHIAYAFLKKDSSVAIVFALLERDTADYRRTAATMKFLHRNYRGSPDSVWLYNARGRADTTSHPLQFFSPDRLRTYNADSGVEFFLDCSNLLLDKYQVSRGIVLDKKYRGITEIYYFTRVGKKVDMEKEIESTKKMFSYKK
ncbi:MAG TPA: hypothetical protein VIQ77_08860, partial [Mucilaginibacter sp.]